MLVAALAVILAVGASRADQVQMLNGDRYVGKVLSLTTNTLVLSNSMLGTIKVPREKVASVSFAGAPSNAASRTNAAAPSQPATNAPASDLADVASQLRSSPALIQRIESQFLAGAGPEAKQKFNELLGGVMNGKITMADLRAQAQSAADQLRAARDELGEDAGFAIDGYLAILDSFLKNSGSGTAATAPKAPTKPAKSDE